MSTEAPVAQRADGCPDPEQLAAYVEGGLPPDERTLLERHLLGCTECRDVLGNTVEALDTESVRVPRPMPKRLAWRATAVGGGLLAAAAAVFLVVRLQRPSPYYVPEMGDLVQAVGSTRPIEPRLTGGFAYGAPPERTRGGAGTGTGSRPGSTVAAAAKVAAAAEHDASATGRAAVGVASLFLGDADAAVQALEDAAGAQPANPKILSDLSAAYLVRSTASSSDLSRALEAAERATRLPDAPPEAWFNRALAVEALDGPDRARAGWQEYLRHEPDGPWADEARRHLDQLPRVSGQADFDYLDAPTASITPSAMSIALGAVVI